MNPAARGLLVASAMVLLLFFPLISGCEPANASDRGVVHVVGRLGTGPGEFGYPRAITVDRQGTFFVVDKTGRIQRFDKDGNLERVWSMPEVEAGKPVGLYAHTDGRLFIADTHYHRVLITDRDGNILDSFGREGTGDGEFSLPTDVAIDADGFIYVSEYYVTERISKWSPDFQFIKRFGEAPIEGRRLSRPAAMVFDDEQTLWVADACNHRLVRFSREGAVLAAIGSLGSDPGEMRYPYDVNMTPEGTLLVCEYGGHRLQWFDKEGTSLKVWGTSGRAPGQLFAPWGAACGADQNVIVVDSLNNRVQMVRP